MSETYIYQYTYRRDPDEITMRKYAVKETARQYKLEKGWFENLYKSTLDKKDLPLLSSQDGSDTAMVITDKDLSEDGVKDLIKECYQQKIVRLYTKIEYLKKEMNRMSDNCDSVKTASIIEKQPKT